jgi:hypothetical protein
LKGGSIVDVTRVTALAASVRARSYLFSGVLAGALSAISFALIHALFISNIWFSVVPMMVAGSLCGLGISWSFRVVVRQPSLGSWLGYNALFVAMLALLGLTSELLFEPITTIPALLQLGGPPDDLFQQAMPLTVTFTLMSAVILSLLYRCGWRGFGAILIASALLVSLLGLNVSIMGLVYIPRADLYRILELYGLILSLGLVYIALFAALERKGLIRATSTKQSRLLFVSDKGD